jgi:hypothetical protein
MADVGAAHLTEIAPSAATPERLQLSSMGQRHSAFGDVGWVLQPRRLVQIPGHQS